MEDLIENLTEDEESDGAVEMPDTEQKNQERRTTKM